MAFVFWKDSLDFIKIIKQHKDSKAGASGGLESFNRSTTLANKKMADDAQRKFEQGQHNYNNRRTEMQQVQ